MMFLLSKMLWPLVHPGQFPVILLALGVPLLWSRWRRAGRALVAVAALVIFVFGVLPTGDMLVQTLEDRFPQPKTLDRVDGIVVLGGSINQRLWHERGQIALNDTAERLTTFVALARRFPQARLIFAGGSGTVFQSELKEAPVARALFTDLGLDVACIGFDDRSRNTRENAIFAKELAKPAPGERWLLITSGVHMPRAVGVFRNIGWDIEAYPVDYRTVPGVFPVGLRLVNGHAVDAIHEWLGLVAYRLFGWTDALFPGPH